MLSFFVGAGALAFLLFNLYLIVYGLKKRYFGPVFVGLFWAGVSLFVFAAVLKGTGWFDGSESYVAQLPPKDITDQDISDYFQYADKQYKLWYGLWQWSIFIAFGYVFIVLAFVITGYWNKLQMPYRNAAFVLGFVISFAFLIYCGNRSVYWSGADYEKLLDFLAQA